MSFEDKVILITGASSGIGAAAARGLAQFGGKVALVGRNEERLNEVAEQIQSDGSPTPLAIVADVTVDAERIIDETVEHFGKLNVLINNAGFGKFGFAPDMEISVFDNLMNTNLRSVVVLTKLAVPHLEKTKGNIVNVSSIGGLIVPRLATFYSMSKAALNQFTACAAFEFGPKGVRVNGICPAMVKTDFFANAEVNEEFLEQFCDERSSGYPLRRIGAVSDTTAAIVYLASDAASFITGVNLPVDGGAVRGSIY